MQNFPCHPVVISAALDYIAARALDPNEDFVAPPTKNPAEAARTGVKGHDRFAELSEQALVDDLACGLPHDEAEVLYAVPQPIAASLFAGPMTRAAWHTKPTRLAVSNNDCTIPRSEMFPGCSNESDHDRARRRTSVPGLASQRSCRSCPAGGRHFAIALRRMVQSLREVD